MEDNDCATAFQACALVAAGNAVMTMDPVNLRMRLQLLKPRPRVFENLADAVKATVSRLINHFRLIDEFAFF